MEVERKERRWIYIFVMNERGTVDSGIHSEIIKLEFIVRSIICKNWTYW